MSEKGTEKHEKVDVDFEWDLTSEDESPTSLVKPPGGEDDSPPQTEGKVDEDDDWFP